MSKHRPGIHEGFLIKHKLKLEGLVVENVEAIQSEIDALIGVDGVWLDLEKHTIKIAYDGSVRDIDEMLEILLRHGAQVSPDWWNQFKLRRDREADQNIKDNAKHEPHCCNKIPPRR